MSVAIYHIKKISTKQAENRVQSEAKVANRYIEDIETKFEFALFNAPKELTYHELYFYFLNQWKRTVQNINTKHKFVHIKINQAHFSNLYQPLV